MKLFEIKPNSGYAPIGLNPDILRGYPRAWAAVTALSLGDKEDLSKIAEKELVVRDTPFHYFTTEYWNEIEREAYEWTLLDIYPGASNDYDQYGMIVSEKAKKLLEQYISEEDYYFYPVNFLYQSNYYNYYIFNNKYIFLKDILYSERSDFYLYRRDDDSIMPYNDTPITFENYSTLIDKYWDKEERYDIRLKKGILKKSLPFYASIGMDPSGYFVTEELKNAIEAADFEGIEFKELDIEFEVLE